jgi:hypothetical protein
MRDSGIGDCPKRASWRRLGRYLTFTVRRAHAAHKKSAVNDAIRVHKRFPPGDDTDFRVDVRRVETGCWTCGDHVEIQAWDRIGGADAVAVQASTAGRSTQPPAARYPALRPAPPTATHRAGIGQLARGTRPRPGLRPASPPPPPHRKCQEFETDLGIAVRQPGKPRSHMIDMSCAVRPYRFVGHWAAPGVLPARMPHADAQKAHIAQGYGWR